MIRSIAMILTCVVLCGCEPGADAYAPKPPVAYTPPPEKPTLPSPPSSDAAAPGDVRMVRVPAKAGAIDPSKYDAAIATSPLTASYSMQQQIIFDAQIPKAMQIFEGVRNRKPSSHQEFMKEIIQKTGIKLPPLPPNYRYIYDPERGELMIEKPADAN